MFVTNWISTTKIQKISEITNFFRHYFLSRTEVNIQHSTFKKSTFNIKIKIMKANTWKTILQIAISVLTAIATTLGVTSCTL